MPILDIMPSNTLAHTLYSSGIKSRMSLLTS